MATNPHFNNFNYAGEQNLIEELVLESIKMYGIDVYYLPRTLVDTDQLFGEDVLSKFETAAPIEMFIKNVEGFEGEKVKSGNNEGKRRLNGWKNANLPWSYTLDRNKMYFEE